MRAALASLGTGAGRVLRAPGVLVVVWVCTVAAALPFALVLGGQLQTALAHQPPIDLAAEEINADWWREYRGRATGLAATFTPAVLGALAPVSNFSALLDGTPRPWALAGPVITYAIVWSLLLGGVLHRYHYGPAGVRTTSAAALRYFPQFVTLTVLAGAVVLLLFVTLHRLIFGVGYSALISGLDSEWSAFAVRVVLYLLFGAVLALVGVTVDYARVALVARTVTSIPDAVAAALRFVQRHTGSVLMLMLFTAVLFAALVAVYIAADQELRGWRSVLLGQLFVAMRLITRLTSAASQVDLFRRLGNA